MPKTNLVGESLEQCCGARAISLQILRKVERQRSFADEAFDRALERFPLSTQDRALAFQLVYGVLRHKENLDWRLNLVADRPLRGLPTQVRLALELGAYQILFLDKVPVSAAVNESVKLVKSLSSRDWSGFVNAVLRQLVRQPAPDWSRINEEPVESLSIQYSCPLWLTERWVARFGLLDTEILCQQIIDIPPITLRTNTLRCSVEELEERFRKEGFQTTLTPVSRVGLTLNKCGLIADLPPIKDGLCYVEDEAAQLIPLALDPQPGERILDICAAPGGKTTHIAALMRDCGEIVAVDRDLPRLQLLEHNCQRLGIHIVTPVLADATQKLKSPSCYPLHLHRKSPSIVQLMDPGFDRILVDAPCSAVGVLRRHPEGKWNKTSDMFGQLQHVQVQLLEQVCGLLRPGGVLVYSACSTEPEETLQVVSHLCHKHPEFQRESLKEFLPPLGHSLLNQEGDLSTMLNCFNMDGFFAARLRRS